MFKIKKTVNYFILPFILTFLSTNAFCTNYYLVSFIGQEGNDGGFLFGTVNEQTESTPVPYTDIVKWGKDILTINPNLKNALVLGYSPITLETFSFGSPYSYRKGKEILSGKNLDTKFHQLGNSQ